MRALLDQIRTNALGYAEIEYFYGPPTSQKQIRWLDVSMNDSGGMGRIQSLTNLNPNPENFFGRESRSGHALLQGFAFEQFDGNETKTFSFVDFVNSANVGVVQRGSRSSFSLESPEGLLIGCEVSGKQLKGDKAPEFHIFGSVNNSHAAPTNWLEDAVMRDDLPF